MQVLSVIFLSFVPCLSGLNLMDELVQFANTPKDSKFIRKTRSDLSAIQKERLFDHVGETPSHQRYFKALFNQPVLFPTNKLEDIYFGDESFCKKIKMAMKNIALPESKESRKDFRVFLGKVAQKCSEKNKRFEHDLLKALSTSKVITDHATLVKIISPCLEGTSKRPPNIKNGLNNSKHGKKKASKKPSGSKDGPDNSKQKEKQPAKKKSFGITDGLKNLKEAEERASKQGLKTLLGVIPKTLPEKMKDILRDQFKDLSTNIKMSIASAFPDNRRMTPKRALVVSMIIQNDLFSPSDLEDVLNPSTNDCFSFLVNCFERRYPDDREVKKFQSQLLKYSKDKNFQDNVLDILLNLKTKIKDLRKFKTHVMNPILASLPSDGRPSMFRRFGRWFLGR